MVQKSNQNQKVAAELNAVKQVHLSGRVQEAEQGYRKLLARYPTLTDVHHPLGIALQQLGRHAEAADHIGRWLAIAPRDHDAAINLGNSLLALGRHVEAAEAFRRAVEIKPSPDACSSLAIAQQVSGDVVAAERSYRQALALRPDFPEGLFNLANLLCDLGRTDEGVAAYEEALRHRPEMPEALVNLGNQLVRLGRVEEGIARLREALRQRPEMPEAMLNLGNALYEQTGEPEEPRQLFERALAVLPTYREALNNLANLYMNQGRMDQALAYTRRLLELHPDAPMAHGTAAGAMLVMGQMEEGWQHYEWRWLRPNLPVPLRDFGRPEWRGEDISARTILLHHEQGLGDSIQFVRFVAQVAARAGKVILEVPGNLRALYACIPDVTLATYGGPLPPFDVQLPLMSLPHVLGVTIDTIPAPIPYLSADPERVDHWRDRLPKGEFRIGIVWQGKAGTSIDRGRSYALEHMAPVARIPGVTLISLQKGYGLDQLQSLPDGLRVETLGPDFDAGEGAFIDTAAVMAHMDLIISSDTSVAHLAGALGRPVWVPLKLSPDWRWLMDREDSPWYPAHMRLFRQREVGDWPRVFDRIAGEVQALKDGDRSRLIPPPPPPRPPLAAFPPVPPPPLPAYRPPVLLQQAESLDVGGGATQTQTRHGTMRYPSADAYVGRCLEAYGEWSEAAVALCTPLLRPGDTVVEAGAGLGYHTLALARAVGPAGRVHAFESQQFIGELLSWNVTANDLSQVVVHRAGVGPVPANDDKTPVFAIDGLALDTLRLIKADANGTELALLRGAQATIGRCRPVLYLADERKDRSSDLIAFILGLGYRVWRHQPPLFSPDNFRGNPHNIFEHVVSANILCIPAERDPIVVGLAEVTGTP